MTYEDIKTVYEDIIDLWGEEDGGKVIVAIHTAPKCQLEWNEFMHRCTACGGNWVAMIATGISRIAPNVYNALPNNLNNPFKAFSTLCNIALLLGVKELPVE